MELALVSSADSLTDIFPELEAFLKEEIMYVTVNSFYAPSALEIPLQVKECLDRKLIFVFLIVKKETADHAIMKEKLLDIEMNPKCESQIAIGIEIYEDKEDADSEKEELVQKWGNYILDRLYHEEKFKPGYEAGAGK